MKQESILVVDDEEVMRDVLGSLLTQAGYEYTGGEVLDSYGWGSWRSRTDRILATFFPAD